MATSATVLANVLLDAGNSQHSLSSRPPALSLHLTPNCDHNGTVHSLLTRMTIENPQARARESLLWMLKKSANVDHNDYSGNRAIVATDDKGHLLLDTEDDDTDHTRRWSTSRATTGDVVLEFEALPRHVDMSTPLGPRSDIRQNGPGLVGSGGSFVPTVIQGNGEPGSSSSPRDYTLHVTWNLGKCPRSTQAVWTYGEGTHPPARVGVPDVLVNSMYAVSPDLRSWLPASERSDSGKIDYGFYWLTDLPNTLLPNVTATAERVGKLVEAFAQDFAPRPSDKAKNAATSVYRIFLRESPHGWGGTAFRDSFVLEWCRGIRFESDVASDEEHFYLLAHEAAHNWPRMDSGKGQQEDGETVWYEEGIAEYYSILLPYELGLVSAESFTRKMSNSLSAFYTSPAINMTLDEAAKRAWLDTNAQRLPYYSGLLYLFRLDVYIRRTSSGKQSLRDPVMDFLDLKRQEKPFTFVEWQGIIERYVGDWAQQELDRMSKGGWVVPPPSTEDLALFARPGDHLELKYKRERVFERGYDPEVKKGRTIIRNVVPGSEAAVAGIRDGDVITWRAYNTHSALDDPQLKVRLSLERDGHPFEVEYLPRSTSIPPVDCWHIVHT